MTGQEQTFPDPETMSDWELKGTAIQFLSVFASGQVRLRGRKGTDGTVFVEVFGVGSLNDLSEEVWQQLAAQGITRDKVSLSEESLWGNLVLALVRERFGAAFDAIEESLKTANAEVKAVMDKANAEIEKISDAANEAIAAFVGAPPAEAGGCCGGCESGSCDKAECDPAACEGGCGCKKS